MGASLPDWFDLDVLRGTVTALIFVCAIAVILVLIFVRTLRNRLIAIGVLLVAAVGLVYYQTTLDDCEETCSCRFVVDYIDTDGCPERE